MKKKIKKLSISKLSKAKRTKPVAVLSKKDTQRIKGGDGSNGNAFIGIDDIDSS